LDIFGLPRIITDEANIDRFLSLNDSPYNGLTLCTGSLGASPKNNIPKLLRKYCEMGRVHFVHARNIKLMGGCDFNETAHPSRYGSIDMYEVMKILYDTNFTGYVRPDHGRMIWGERESPVMDFTTARWVRYIFRDYTKPFRNPRADNCMFGYSIIIERN
jgi:mannonate dehydratase